MRPTPVLLTLVVSAAAATPDISSLLPKLPQCSVECLVNGVTANGCNVTDLACQCSKLKVLVNAIAPCLVHAGCNLTQIANTGEAVVNLCKELQAGSSGGSGTVPSQTGEPSSTSSKHNAAVNLQHMGWLGIAALAVGPLLL